MAIERVNLEDELAGLPDVQVKVWAPRPVEIALEGLVLDLMKRARELGDVARGEVVGALVMKAQDESADLIERLKAYREAKVHELLPGETRTSGSKTLPARVLGRPPRRVR